MPRPKVKSDEEVLDAALALLRTGRLTFASVAAASGLSGATLVQRFGSKDGLRRAALQRAWDGLQARTRELAATTPPTPEGAVELLVGLSGAYADFDRYAENLLILREDLRDPVLRARGAAWEQELVAALEARCGAGSGHLLAAHWQGAVTWWAFRPDTDLAAELRASLTQLVALLASARSRPRAARARADTPRRPTG
jgi:AcrR family transcriptional regulator